jgi:hypothetical protein
MEPSMSPNTQKDHGKVLQDAWLSCYSDSWNGLIVPDAFAH